MKGTCIDCGEFTDLNEDGICEDCDISEEDFPDEYK